VEELDLGPLLPHERVTKVKTTKRWTENGKKKWQGTTALKGTQHLPLQKKHRFRIFK
jgi:hypothetical protein